MEGDSTAESSPSASLPQLGTPSHVQRRLVQPALFNFGVSAVIRLATLKTISACRENSGLLPQKMAPNLSQARPRAAQK